MLITIQDIKNKAKDQLSSVYNSQEINKLLFMLFESRLNMSSAQVLAFSDTKVSQSDYNQISNDLNCLAQHEPIQYILGFEWFYDLKFKVNKHVLIPRPETEELVKWILDDYGTQSIKLVDIGTGSGCIPITLAYNEPDWNVSAVDVSRQALKMALSNAKENRVAVKFIEQDMLADDLAALPQGLDVVVSNPPYVKNAEKLLMHKNVLEFEPHLALFVDDNDPLIFYRKIANYAFSSLKKGGAIYFEINEALAKETSELLGQIGFEEIQVRKDLFDRNRMVKACKL